MWQNRRKYQIYKLSFWFPPFRLLDHLNKNLNNKHDEQFGSHDEWWHQQVTCSAAMMDGSGPRRAPMGPGGPVRGRHRESVLRKSDHISSLLKFLWSVPAFSAVAMETKAEKRFHLLHHYCPSENRFIF